MKRVLIALTGAFLALNGSICAAQSTQAPTTQMLQNKFVQSALHQRSDQHSDLRLATIQVPQQETQYIWDSEKEEWRSIVHYTYTYNNEGLKQTITERTLPENEERRRTIDISYNEQGQELESIVQMRNGDAWVNHTRTRHEYDGQHGEIKLTTHDVWVNNSWEFSTGTRYTYTTGPGNRIEQSIREDYSDGSWENSSKNVNTYNGSGTDPVTSINSEWQNGAWVEVERTTEIVFENGQPKSLVNEYYDDEDEEWIKMRHTFEYTTDAANNTTSVIIVQSMEEDGAWVPVSRITSTGVTSGETYLDAQGMTEMKMEVRLGTEWTLITHIVTDITRNDNGYITEIVTRSYDMESNEFENLIRIVYSDFVSLNTTSAESEVLAAALQLYPNPTHDNLKIALDLTKVQGASLSIYNLTGQKVLELASLRGETVVDLRHLPSGVYMVRVTGTNKAGITRKIVKQ